MRESRHQQSIGGWRQNEDWGLVDVSSTSWWRKGHPATKLHQLLLMKCTFPTLHSAFFTVVPYPV